jgi:serine protease
VRRSTTFLVALLIVVPLVIAGTPQAQGSSGTIAPFIVGFHEGSQPPLAPGDRFEGLVVEKVSASGSFLVVEARDLATATTAVAGAAGVRYVEPDVRLRALQTPDDPRYGEQYGPPLMGAPAAWDDAGFGSAAVTVAVIDTGIRRTHEDFESGRVLGGHDYVNGDNDPADDCGHGTHVAGTVGATTDNGRGVAGMSQATILPLRALGAIGGLITLQCTGSTSDIAEAIRDASDQGADIISMSIGGGGSTTLQSAVQYAWSQGSLLVAAAGNDGASNSIDFPAAYPEVIAVGAVTASKARASYSDGGPQLEVMAPGSDVLSTSYSSNTSYASLSGTSMATPHVAGTLALALSCAPAGTSPAALRQALADTAEDLGASGRDTSYGYGLARVDLLVDSVCTGTGGGQSPSASFTADTDGLTVHVDGTGSSDPNGDPLTYSWTFGDGGTATGPTASHTYSSAGTYPVTLTVDDGTGGTDVSSTSVTVGSPTDPDPSTPTIRSGEAVTITLSGSGDQEFFKIAVPDGTSQLQVVTDGPACGLLTCSLDADLYTRHGARPTDSTYACRPYVSGSDETCTHSSPTEGWWYVRVKSFSGSGEVTLRATIT